MPAELTSVKDADSILLGLGILAMCALPSSSPQTFIDVGYIKSMNVTYTREYKDFESAGALVVQYVFRDRYSWESTWAEVSITNLSKVFQATTITPEHIQFGGGRTITRYALKFEHTRQSDSKILQLNMWRAVPSGEFSLAFAEEEFIQYPVTFAAQIDSTKAVGRQYGSVRLIAA